MSYQGGGKRAWLLNIISSYVGAFYGNVMNCEKADEHLLKIQLEYKFLFFLVVNGWKRVPSMMKGGGVSVSLINFWFLWIEIADLNAPPCHVYISKTWV